MDTLAERGVDLDLDLDLAQALKAPSVVLLSGARPVESRNAWKKTSPLLRMGAALMLGVAMLSPLNAAAQPQLPTMEQTTEIVAAEQAGQEAQVAPSQAGQEMEIDWLAQVQARNDEAFEKIDLALEQAEAARVQRQEEWAQMQARHAAEREHRQVEYRREAPAFTLKRDVYEIYKDLDLGEASLSEASPQQLQKWVGRLVDGAYYNIQAGHTAQDPSQELIYICGHLNDVAKVADVATLGAAGAEAAPDSGMVLQACSSGQMATASMVNTVLRGAGVVALAVGGGVAMALRSYGLGGMAGAGTSTHTTKDVGAWLERRRNQVAKQNWTPSDPRVPKRS